MHCPPVSSTADCRCRSWGCDHIPFFVALGIVLAAMPSAAANAQATDFDFAPPIVRVLVGDHFPTHIGLGDLNGDDKLDIVIPGRNADGRISYALGNGNGTFGPLLEIIVEAQTDWVQIRDFNGDRKLDLAFAIRSVRGRVGVIFGNGDGTFAPTFAEYDVGRETRCIVAEDFDGDGDIDIVACNYLSGDVRVLGNDGDGTFTPGQRVLLNEYVAGFAFPQQIIAGDVDGDRDLDLVVTAIGAGRISVLRNLGNLTFSDEVAWAPTPFAGLRPAVTNSALVDIDSDGDLDIVSPLGFGGVAPRFAVFVNNGTGSFNVNPSFPASAGGTIPWTIAAGPIDGDDDADVVVGFGVAGVMGFVSNTSTGAVPSFLQPQEQLVGDFVRHMELRDLDGDCDLDVVLVEMGDHEFRVYLNQTPGAGGCDGGVAAASGLAGPGLAPQGPWANGHGTAIKWPADLLDENNDGIIDAIDEAITTADWPPLPPSDREVQP